MKLVMVATCDLLHGLFSTSLSFVGKSDLDVLGYPALLREEAKYKYFLLMAAFALGLFHGKLALAILSGQSNQHQHLSSKLSYRKLGACRILPLFHFAYGRATL